jgi:hypothetical protein
MLVPKQPQQIVAADVEGHQCRRVARAAAASLGMAMLGGMAEMRDRLGIPLELRIGLARCAPIRRATTSTSRRVL